MSDPRDELADADIISGGGDFGAFAASRWPKLVRLVRSRCAMIIAVSVLAGAVATGALLVAASQPANRPGPPGQQIAMTSTAVRAAGVVGPDGWVGPAGCRRGRDCPRG